MIKDHAAALLSLGIIAILVAMLTLHGMKDETLLAILATGSVGIANTIAGVKKDSSTTIGDNATVNVPRSPENSGYAAKGSV